MQRFKNDIFEFSNNIFLFHIFEKYLVRVNMTHGIFTLRLKIKTEQQMIGPMENKSNRF